MKSKPISDYTDHSTQDGFRFIFYCERCGAGVESEVYAFQTLRLPHPLSEKARALLWTRQHDEAYERANNEARTDFNLCPVCGRRVCCDCFYVAAEEVTDLCVDCEKTKQKKEELTGMKKSIKRSLSRFLAFGWALALCLALLPAAAYADELEVEVTAGGASVGQGHEISLGNAEEGYTASDYLETINIKNISPEPLTFTVYFNGELESGSDDYEFFELDPNHTEATLESGGVKKYTIAPVEELTADGGMDMTGVYFAWIMIEEANNGDFLSFIITFTVGEDGGVDPDPDEAPQILSASSFSCVAGTGGAFQLELSGTEPITLTLEGEPNGVTLNNNLDTLNVAATVPAGVYDFTIRAQNDAGDVEHPFTLTVTDAAVAPTITKTDYTYEAGQSASLVLEATGTAPIIWSAPNGLPDGISLTQNRLEVADTVTAQEYRFQIKAENNAGSMTREFTLTVTEAIIPLPDVYALTIRAGLGGRIVTGTSGDYPAGDVITIEAAALGDYYFTGWASSNGGVFADRRGIRTTFTMPANATTITANFYDGGLIIANSDSDGGSGGSSGGSSSAVTMMSGGNPPTTQWQSQSQISTLASGARAGGLTGVRTTSTGEYGMRGGAWASLAGLTYTHDTIAGNAVQVRVSISDPTLFTQDALLSGHVTGSDVERVESLFERYFANEVQVLHFDQSGQWEQPVQVAAKFDLTGMDTQNLHFYAYDRATNTYRIIENTEYWIDSNGYTHFTTPYAGDIIVSDGPLRK